MLRWIGWTALGLFVLLLAVTGGGGAYLWHASNQGLKPAPEPTGLSLMSYASEAPVRAVAADPAGRFEWVTIAAPPREAMPWVRWWWPGGDVEPAELDREMAAMHAANFGGAGIQPFSSGTERIMHENPASRARVMSVDTPRYHETVRAALTSAKRLGLRIDVSNYSGLPAGKPLVTSDLGNHGLEYTTLRLAGGKAHDIALPLPLPRPSLNMRPTALISKFAGSEPNPPVPSSSPSSRRTSVAREPDCSRHSPQRGSIPEAYGYRQP